MDHHLKESARMQRLHALSRQVRHVAIGCQEDLQGWRVSNLLRDAVTPAEADEAERQLRIWEAQARQQIIHGKPESISS